MDRQYKSFLVNTAQHSPHPMMHRHRQMLSISPLLLLLHLVPCSDLLLLYGVVGVNILNTARVNPSRVVWGPSHALCRGLVRGSTQQQAGRPPVFRACAVGTLNPPRGAGGETYETLHWCSWCSFSPASPTPRGHWPHVPTGRVCLTTITPQTHDFQTVTVHCTVCLVLINNHHYSSTVFN